MELAVSRIQLVMGNARALIRFILIISSAGFLLLAYQNCSGKLEAQEDLFSTGGFPIPTPTSTISAPIFEFPPFQNYRTDFNSSTKGLSSNPLTISSCQISPVVDWQAVQGLCNVPTSAKSSYPNSFSYNLNQNFTKYWVLSVNDEPAFTENNFGPANQSLPLNTGIVEVTPIANQGFTLGLTSASAGGITPLGNTFISYGLEMGRGLDQPILPDLDYKFSFDVILNNILAQKGCTPQRCTYGNSVHLWLEIQAKDQISNPTSGTRRKWLWLFLGERQTGATLVMNWNWPIAESMWYPGAVIYMDIPEHYSSACGENVNKIVLEPSSIGTNRHYEVDIAKMATCMGGFNKNDYLLTGLHFALEQNTIDGNLMRATFKNFNFTK